MVCESDDELLRWKRSLSEPSLAAPGGGKRRRRSRSSEPRDSPPPPPPSPPPPPPSPPASPRPDARDILQQALDHICELQRRLSRAPPAAVPDGDSDLSDDAFEAFDATDSDHDADVEDEDTLDAWPALEADGPEPQPMAAWLPRGDPAVRAGFDACCAEVLRFLAQNEGLRAPHAALSGLASHLAQRRTAL